MKMQLIRHATLWLEYGGKNILVDPMLSEAGVNPPIQNSTNDRRNPLVPLSVSLEAILNPDMIMVTHLHRDHWDETAMQQLPKTTPLVCQPGDEHAISAQGFTNILPVANDLTLGRISLNRTGGQHGTGDIGRAMGQVSGFVLQAEDEPTLYLAGDTIYCTEVREALDAFRPEWIVVNAGGARFAAGDPITMTTSDVAAVCEQMPHAKVIAVHMEAINHCLLTRAQLAEALDQLGLKRQVNIPQDGEWA